MTSAERVESLRTEHGPQEAHEAAWAWIVELQDLAKVDAKRADAELNDLFRLGAPAIGLDGPTDGILVMTTTNPVLDKAAKLLTSMWMPWEGKSFNSESQVGENRMTEESVVPSKLIWPLYSMKHTDEGHRAFDFETYVEAGKDDPDREVLVIDYANVSSNPRLLIRSIRDELVEIVPGAYLGKVLLKLPTGGYSKIGYFALRTQ
jgi:hypothetical protein